LLKEGMPVKVQEPKKNPAKPNASAREGVR